MTVSSKELRDYTRNILRRKTFRFHQVNGLIDEKTHDLLELAKAFSTPSGDSRSFLYALRDAPPQVRERINAEFAAVPASSGASAEARRDLLRRIQGHIVSEGVYADFGRPASVGLIMERREFDGIDLYFSLGESHPGLALMPGRVYHNPEGRTVVLFYLWDALARVTELLDLLMSRRDLGEEGNFERTLYRARHEDLERWCQAVSESGKPGGQSPDFYLFTIAMRSALSSLRAICNEADSPREMLRRAVNVYLDSLVAHEVSHLAERKANGSLPFDKEKAEIAGYLIQAVYSRADFAFISMTNREFNFEKEMPELVSEIRSKGVSSVLEGADYLRSHARRVLDREFDSYCGRPHSDVLETAKIRAAQTTDYIRPEHMPIVEKAMCNPSLNQSG